MSSKAYQEAYKYMSDRQKDAMYRLLQGCINHDGHSWATFGDIENCVAEILMSHKEENKYRLHDLRKNPEDLPPSYRWVMCSCQGKQYQVMRMDVNGDWLTWYPDTATYMHSFVIAWREIEPFEEVEE